eukprot:CAMPEP_0185022256 /NCGR_PEP_ID=MMETSP1103-20130426/4974_1 /TAXON_ID=36769 /ORGANISM="Paraphysomonas bandaiensis, Strain Caron Lab Isolate" /LENGTH=1344 /DNA_ID=CAMNT_0027554245 /DNA_START=188 /DNA_END=4219 /DNA_ORIENTATION=-
MLLYSRDKNSLNMGKAVRLELNKLYVATELKDATRALHKDAARTDSCGIDILAADLDHTTLKLLEVLNKRAKSEETRRLPSIPVVILVPEHTDEDIKNHLLSMGGYDVLLTNPVTPHEFFSAVVDLLHRRAAVETAYDTLRKKHKNIKYPHLNIFEDERAPQHRRLQESDDDDEEEDDDEDDSINPEDSLGRTSGVYDVDPIDCSTGAELHPESIVELRALHMKNLRKRNYTTSRYQHSWASKHNDIKERQTLDKMIIKSILKDSESGHHARDSDSEEDIGGSRSKQANLATEEDNDSFDRPTRRVAQLKNFYRSDSCNIMDESTRPKLKINNVIGEGSVASDGTEATMFGSDILPFVEKPRPDMTKPTSVGGLNKRAAMACWKVLHTQHKFGPGHVDHQHDKPWNTNKAKVKEDSVIDETGTLELDAVKKVLTDSTATRKDENLDVKNVPTTVRWTAPQRYFATGRNRRRFLHELKHTKRKLSALAEANNSSPGSRNGSNAVSPRSIRPHTTEEKSRCVKSEEEMIAGKLSVIRDWRGIAEDFSHDDEGKRTGGSMRLVAALRSAGGLQFGNIIVGAKARLKARRLIRDMASTAKPDPGTAKLILVSLENRRIGSGEREHLVIGIKHQQAGDLNLAFKAFNKAILVCKQSHIPTMCRGIVQYERGKFFSAIKDFTAALKAMELSPDSIRRHLNDIVIARFNRAMSYFRLGDDEKGLKDLQFAVECTPNNTYVREMLVLAYRRNSQYIDAIAHCHILKEMEHNNQIKEAQGHSSKNTAVQHATHTGRPTIVPGARRLTSNQSTPNISRRMTGVAASLSAGGAGEDCSVNDKSNLKSISDGFNEVKALRVDIKEHQFPGLKDLKNQYISKKKKEEAAQTTLYLENFKHANGFKRHLFDTLFVRLSPLQEALITLPTLRSQEQIKCIAEELSVFPVLGGIPSSEMLELAACVEYRTVTSKSTIFYQDDPIDAMVLVLSGQLQLRLESGQQTKVLSVVGLHESYGEMPLLFRHKHSPFVERLLRMCSEEGNMKNEVREFSIDGTLMHKSDDSSSDKFNTTLPRSLQPGSFMSCKVSEPSELMVIHYSAFDKYLSSHFEREFMKKLDLLIANGSFGDGTFTPQEMVRLARMSTLRHYSQGDVILKQGAEPECVYFILKGICKVTKRPDPTQYLVRRLADIEDAALTHDQKYAFHHRLRHTIQPCSEEARKSHPDMKYMTACEEEREAMDVEIAKLKVQVAREKAAEERRREEEEEMRKLGRPVPNKFVDIATLHWPQLFGEAALLLPDSGTSLGTVTADAVCEILCVHKMHLQTFHIDDRLLYRVRQRAVLYPPDEKLILMLGSNTDW